MGEIDIVLHFWRVTGFVVINFLKTGFEQFDLVLSDCCSVMLDEVLDLFHDLGKVSECKKSDSYSLFVYHFRFVEHEQ